MSNLDSRDAQARAWLMTVAAPGQGRRASPPGAVGTGSLAHVGRQVAPSSGCHHARGGAVPATHSLPPGAAPAHLPGGCSLGCASSRARARPGPGSPRRPWTLWPSPRSARRTPDTRRRCGRSPGWPAARPVARLPTLRGNGQCWRHATGHQREPGCGCWSHRARGAVRSQERAERLTRIRDRLTCLQTREDTAPSQTPTATSGAAGCSDTAERARPEHGRVELRGVPQDTRYPGGRAAPSDQAS